MITGRQNSNLESRALATYHRFAGLDSPQPAAHHTTVRELDGRSYVTLGNGNGLLACYRVRPNGHLKRLARVPSELVY